MGPLSFSTCTSKLDVQFAAARGEYAILYLKKKKSERPENNLVVCCNQTPLLLMHSADLINLINHDNVPEIIFRQLCEHNLFTFSSTEHWVINEHVSSQKDRWNLAFNGGLFRGRTNCGRT